MVINLVVVMSLFVECRIGYVDIIFMIISGIYYKCFVIG